MKEKPAVGRVVKETPVLEPDLYLLNQKNSDFLQHKVNSPVFSTGPATIALVAFAAVIFLALALILFLFIRNPIVVLALTSAIVLVSLFIATRGADRRHPNRAWILDGKIVHAETIRISTYDGRALTEKVRIKYQFVTPGGVVKEALLEADNAHASQLMAPAPETLVRVWYADNGKFHLL